MLTNVTSPAQITLPPIEILDLRHFSANSLRPVLEAENRVWAERLNWDYRASANLLLQYVDARVLPGFVAVEHGRVIGYAFCVYEERKAVIGDLFAIEQGGFGYSAHEVEQKLLENLLALLQNSPGVERIEAQLLLHGYDAHAATFRAAGFGVYRRLFMESLLQSRRFNDPALSAACNERVRGLAGLGLELRTWHDNDFNLAGPLIAHAYEGHLDATINDQYRSVAGSLRFLHNIIRFPGCGIFDKEASHVLVHKATGALAGLVLCSRVREDVEHVTQLCVARPARGTGLGALLLEVAAASLARKGYGKLSLTVTAGNDRAEGLYRRVGFAEQHSFNAVVWTPAKRKGPMLHPNAAESSAP